VSNDGMMSGRSGFGDYTYYGGAPHKKVARGNELYNPNQPPGGDYANYYWVPGMGWQYNTSAAVEGAHYSKVDPNDSDNRVYYEQEPGRKFDRDQEYWDKKRPLIGGLQAWKAGGDLFATQEGWRYTTDNPYVYTEEMQAAEDNVNSIATHGIYDPETDTTFWGGMTYKGDHTGTKTEADFSPEDWQWLQNDRYYTGHDQLTPEGYAALKEAMGGRNTVSPFVDTFSHDVDSLLASFAGGSDVYNPLYGRIDQSVIDRNRELGHIGEGLTAYEKRTRGNAMDYIYDKFSNLEQVGNRADVVQRFEDYKKKLGLKSENFYNIKMNQYMFDQLGLSDFGMEFDRDYGKDKKQPNLSGVGGGVNLGTLGDNPLAGRSGGGGGFLDAYNKEKERIESKPSVKSLMQEMVEFKGE